MIAPPAPYPPQSDDDSDSDWDDDDDFAAKKINIKIKPIAQVTPSKISASVDELRATVGTWKSLANINLVKPNSRRHQSTLKLNTNGNGNHDGRHQEAGLLAPSTAISSSSAVLPDVMMFPNEAPAPPLPPPINLAAGSSSSNSTNNTARHQGYDVLSNGMLLNSNGGIRDSVLDYVPPQQVNRDLENFIGLQPKKVEPQTSDIYNLANGLLQPTAAPLTFSSSAGILSPGLQSAFSGVFIHDEAIKFPVAYAIQECLNAKLIRGANGVLDTGASSASLIGRVKMAIPSFHGAPYPENNLEVTLVTSVPWNKIRLNNDFVRQVDQPDRSQPFVPTNSTMRLTIDMGAVKDYVKKQHQIQTSTRYYILPELFKYIVGSQEEKQLSLDTDAAPPQRVNPIHALSHWLCDLNMTKVRVDIQFLENTLDEFGLSTNDIRNIKISMHVNGGVTSYQSKPDANWNPLDSKLTWSFTNLTELVSKSTLNGITSCLARFELSDGPSTPSDVSLQFSIPNKTISGTHVILNDTKHFRLATQKYEVRTGVFKCEPPGI